jgi:outer membrane protein assembly factor BamD (BamD/ComL family)
VFGIEYFWTKNYNKGLESLSKGNYRQAIPSLNYAVYLLSNKVESRIGLGRAYFLADSLENAAAQFDGMIRIT